MLSIYLDNHTVSRPSPRAIAAMHPFLAEKWGSPYAPYSFGQQLLGPISKQMQAVEKLLYCTPQDIVLFTSSGSEAINHVVLSTYFDVTRENGRNHFVSSVLEEAPLILALSRLEQLGCTQALARPEANGEITAASIEQVLTPQTALVSLAWANGMTGVIHPVAEIGQLCREKGILFHLDASYVLGKMSFDLDEIGADLISFNGAVLHAPVGIGGLCLRGGIELSPLIMGGPEQGGLRGGELNVPGLVALGEAAEEALQECDLMTTEVARLRDLLETLVQKELPDTAVLFQESLRLPNSTLLAFPGVSNEALLYMISRKGVFASFGGGNFQQLGFLLTACGIEEALAHSTLHFSLSRYTTEEEIETAAHIIVQCAQQLKKASRALF